MEKTIKDLRDKDQFFTKEEIAKRCIEKTKDYVEYIRPFLEEVVYIEPSAGNGDFFFNFPQDEFRKAYDIEIPFDIKDEKYIQLDFLKDVGSMSWHSDGYIRDAKSRLYWDGIFVGNPPFGDRGNLAYEFILKCIKLEAAIIAFILPPNINTNSRLKEIREKGYELVSIDMLPSDSFYFYSKDKESVAFAESNFQIYMKKLYIEKANLDIITDVNLKNDEFVQVFTINRRDIINPRRDTAENIFIQKGIGTKWIGKCDFYIPLRVFNSSGKPTHRDSFSEDFFNQDIGFGIICQDKDIKNKIIVENCYTVGTNKVRIAKKQLILKEINRVRGLER